MSNVAFYNPGARVLHPNRVYHRIIWKLSYFKKGLNYCCMVISLQKLASLHKCNTELREHLQLIERETTYIRQCLEDCLGRPIVERILEDLWSSQNSDRTVNPNVHG